MRVQKLIIVITSFFFSTLIYAQGIELCEPLGATSCENPYIICADTRVDFCECPLFEFTPEFGIFGTNLSFEFYSDGAANNISILTGGDDWFSTDILLYGPLLENSSCSELAFATSDPDQIVIEQVVDGNLNNIQMSTVPGIYRVVFVGVGTHGGDVCPYLEIDFEEDLVCYDEPCETCIGSFAPIPGGKYLIGAWAKESNASPNKTTYDNPEVSVIFSNGSTTTTFGPFSPQGEIIDGWQRIEEEITVPTDAISIQVVLSSVSGDVYFDDIRMFPFDASMKSYVYDPINMRLSAELDERHYATFYEYDEEGKLVRIKKETEKGVMTIQETKSNSSK